MVRHLGKKREEYRLVRDATAQPCDPQKSVQPADRVCHVEAWTSEGAHVKTKEEEKEQLTTTRTRRSSSSEVNETQEGVTMRGTWAESFSLWLGSARERLAADAGRLLGTHEAVLSWLGLGLVVFVVFSVVLCRRGRRGGGRQRGLAAAGKGGAIPAERSGEAGDEARPSGGAPRSPEDEASTKKAKKKSKAEQKHSSDLQDDETSNWETKVSVREKRQQKKEKRGKEQPGGGGSSTLGWVPTQAGRVPSAWAEQGWASGSGTGSGLVAPSGTPCVDAESTTATARATLNACVPGWAVGSGVDGGPALASVPAAATVAAVTAVTASTAAVVAAVPPGGAVEKGSGVNGTDDASVWGPTPAEASGVHREWAGPGPVPPPVRVCGEDDVFANMGWAPGAGGTTTAVPPIVDDAWSVEGDFKSSVQNPDWSFPEEEWAASNPVEPPLQVAPETEAMEGENGKASPDDEEKSEATQQTTGAKPKKKNKKKKKKNKTSDEATGAEEGAGDVDGFEAVEAAGPPEAEEAVNRSEAPVTEAVPLPPVAAVTPPPPLPPVSVVQKVGQAEENWEGVKQAKKAGKKKARREI
ncbi:unnamed protein product [Lampetra planeri]